MPREDTRAYSFTGRIAGWSARHRWLVLTATLVLLVVAIALNAAFGVITSEVVGSGEARKGWELFTERFGTGSSPNELVVVRNEGISADDPAFRGVVEALTDDLRAIEELDSVTSHYENPDGTMISEDGHAVMIRSEFVAAEMDELEQAILPVLDVVEAADTTNASAGYEVGIFGEVSAWNGISAAMGSDTTKILIIALVGGFFIVFLVFRSAVSSLIPITLGMIAILITVGAAVPVSRLQALNMHYYEMVVLIGLAVGVDYSLFIISRYREMKATGLDKFEAIMGASDTTGRAVFFAGVTVVISLGGMILTQDALFIGLGLGAMIVVSFALILSLTLLPALLAILGHRIEWIRIPGSQPGEAGQGIWSRIVGAVLERPVVFSVTTLALLFTMAIPFLSIELGSTPLDKAFNWDEIANNQETRISGQGMLLMRENFTLGEAQPLMAVVDPGENGSVITPAIEAATDDFVTRLEQSEDFEPPFGINEAPDGNLLMVSIPTAGYEDDERTEESVRTLRSEIVPAAFADAGVEVLVFGNAAYDVDAKDNVRTRTPLVFAFILGLSFIILLLMFRSIVIPVKAIILNLISVAAAYGVVVAVFQWGYGESILSFESAGITEIFLPLFMFAVLFGLSMDYHMLLLNRVRESHDQGLSNEEAVSFGVRRTASQITSAAAIMVLVFGAFATSGIMVMKQIGLGLGVAILIDATLIRAILLPASMKLLGEWNWYLPSWLEWLPQINPERR